MALKGYVKKYPWKAAYFCVECGGRIGRGEKMHSHGVCPLCGASTGKTIVKTTTRARRFIETSPLSWWDAFCGKKKGRGYYEEK